MSAPSFRIDKDMLQNFSPDAINSKNDLLGFYKSDDHTYVITTRNHTTNPNFISQSSQIVALFADAQFSLDESFEDARDSMKFLQYLDCVYRVIDRHNNNVTHYREHKIVQFLLTIPYISSAVEWVFDQLLFNPPESACGTLENKQREIIKEYLESADNLDTLITYRDNLLTDLTSAENPNNPLRGQGLQEALWIRERRMIQQEFEEQIFKHSDALQLAQNILDEHENALDFGLEIDPFEGPNRCTARLQFLALSDQLNLLASDAQKILIKAAQDKVMHAFGEWHLQRIQMVCKNACQMPLIADLLVSNKPEEFTKKFFSLVSRLSSLQADEEIDILNKHFAAHRKSLIEGRLNAVENLQMLQACKEELLKELETTKTQQDPRHAKEFQAEFWKNEQLTIQKVFEEELDERSEIVQKIHRVMAGSEFKDILGFDDDVDPFKAVEHCKAQMESLNLTPELILLDSARLNGLLNIAKKKIADTYAQYQANRICTICMRDNPPITEVLFWQDATKFEEKYTSLVNRLTKGNRPDAVKHLHQQYEAYLANLFHTLRESLNTPNTLFLDILDIELLTARYKEKNKILDEWYAFKKSNHSDIAQGDLEDFKFQLKQAYNSNLSQIKPCFALCLEILGERKSETMLLIQGTTSTAPNQSIKWYQNKLGKIKFELSQPYAEHLSSHAIEKMKEAEKHTLFMLGELESNQLRESLAKKEKSESIFTMAGSILPSFVSNMFTDNSEQPLKSYREMLMKVLKIKKEKQIEEAYTSKMKELSELPIFDATKSEFINLYESYQRALKIQPLIRIVNTGTLWKEKISLQKLCKENNTVVLGDVEKLVNDFINLLDSEIEIQKHNTENSIVPTLETVKSQLEDQFEEMVIQTYPAYKKMKTICKHTKEPCLGMHKYLIGIPFQDGYGNSNYKEAIAEYEKKLKEFEFSEDSSHPMIVLEASLKIKTLIALAYKEWEAEHIISAAEKFTNDNVNSYYYSDDKKEKARSTTVLGFPKDAPRAEKIKRYRNLCSFLHPDKNYATPEEFSNRFDEAVRYLGNPPQ